MRKNTKQLTEEQLRQYIKESVHQQLNELNKYGKFWNDIKNGIKNKFKGKKKNTNAEPEEYDDFEYDNSTGYNGNDNQSEWYSRYLSDNNGPSQNHIESGYNNESGYESYPEFDPYEQQQDFNNTPLYQDNRQQNQRQEEAPAEQPVEATAAQPEQASQETPQQSEQAPQEEPQQAEPEPQQPAYQRKGDDGRIYSERNEEVITNYIKPAFNSIGQAYRALLQLTYIEPGQYNDVALLQSATKDFDRMINGIKEILPTMRDVRGYMKTVLYKNAIRDRHDYEHYGLEEQRLRKIISRSVSKILKEHHIY